METILEEIKKVTYPRTFWTANSVELLERAAYYAMFISITLYLTNLIGFTDIEAGWISAIFAAFLYFMPTFSGALADKIGFKKALLIAFSLLFVGYFFLGAILTKFCALFSLSLLMLGGSFIKSVVTGTVAQASDSQNRAKAFSIFYMMVNIGSFTGKTVSKFIRVGCGLQYINYFSALICLVAFFVVLFLFKNIDNTGETKSFKDILSGLVRVLSNGRFMALILIVGAFWSIQHQLYATMPKYVLRTVGEGASPEWYANLNPLMVVFLVAPITELTSRLKIKSSYSILISLLIIPCSALTMSLGPWIASKFGPSVHLLKIAVHPVTIALLTGIALQGISECFLSPRFLEFASKQAPAGETALYMGFSHINSFVGNFLGFGISGYLLTKWCPDPKTLSPEQFSIWQSAIQNHTALPQIYAHAHYIWYVFSAIGITAFIAMLIFIFVTERIDRKRAKLNSEKS